MKGFQLYDNLCIPGNTNPRVTSQSSHKVRIQIASEAPEEKINGNKDGVRFLGMLPF